MLALAATVSVMVLIGTGLSLFAYKEYSKRRKKEKALKNIKEYQDHLISDEIDMVLRSFNGSDPYSDDYKKAQKEIDNKWDDSCKLVEKIEKKFS